MEIVVTVQVIGQETKTALKGHQFCTPWQIFQFRREQTALGALQEASGIAFIQFQIKVDLGKIFLILSAVICTETDGYDL